MRKPNRSRNVCIDSYDRSGCNIQEGLIDQEFDFGVTLRCGTYCSNTKNTIDTNTLDDNREEESWDGEPGIINEFCSNKGYRKWRRIIVDSPPRMLIIRFGTSTAMLSHDKTNQLHKFGMIQKTITLNDLHYILVGCIFSNGSHFSGAIFKTREITFIMTVCDH